MKFELKFLGEEAGSIDLTPVEPYLKGLPQLIRAFFAGVLHPDVSGWMKLYALAGIIYFFSPMDIVPDFITGVGFVDDAIFSLLIMQAFLHRIPRSTLSRILRTENTEESLAFFNVKEATSAFVSLFGSLYRSISDRFSQLVEEYSSAQQGKSADAPKEAETTDTAPETGES